MKIVVEGCDNSGKTTLIRYLSDALGIPIVVSGGPSKYAGEVNERAEGFNNNEDTALYDRHPCVSQNIYQEGLMLDGELVEKHHIERFYAQEPFIIYCRNMRGSEGHVLSEHSSAEYFQLVDQNMDRIRSLYDAWALDHANYVYRIGDSMADVLLSIQAHVGGGDFNPWADIVEFHTKFQQAYDGKPRQLPPDLQKFRNGFMDEELAEYKANVEAGWNELESYAAVDMASFVYHLEQQFDALIDLSYVTLGAAYFHGFNFPEGWRRVHHANMQKVLAIKDGVATENVTDSGRDKKFDVVKPAGWQPPSHTDLVEDHAHR